MANVNSLMSSSSSAASNLYGTRNVLSGLASGMDTEAMIENSVSGYKAKITQLQQQQTKYEWKQDAYRSITDKLYAMNETYTSYTSKTNLYSNAFFNNSIKTTPVGAAADKVSATGKSSSDIQILAAQAATAASYTVKADALGLQASNSSTMGMDLNSNVTVGKLKGSMTLDYDGQKIELTFDETDLIDNSASHAEGTKTLAQAIQDKLKETTVTTKFGSLKASDVITVSDSGGAISFSENTANNKQGATPYVSYIQSSLQTALGATESELYAGSSTKKYTLSNPSQDFTEPKTAAAYLAGKDISVTVDGVAKSFRLNQNDINDGNIKKAFEDGFKSIGVNVNVTASGANGHPPLTFSPANPSSNLLISANDEKANGLLGFGDGVSNYLNTKASIGSLLGSKFDFQNEVPAPEDNSTVLARLNSARADSDGYYTDATTGNRYEKVDNNFYRVSDKNERLYDLQINGKKVYVSKDASLESVLDAINNSDAGVKAAYSKLTGSFTFTSKETGESGNISFDNDLAKRMFGSTTKQLTLGDVLDESWFDEDGKVELFTGLSSGNLNSKGEFNKTDSVADFLKKFNAVASNAQFFDDSSSANASGKNTSNAFTGYNLAIKGAGSYLGNDTYAANYRISNVSGKNSGITMQEFVDMVNKANAGAVKGADAQVRAMVNGETVNFTRSSNEIDMDGMTVTLKGSFGERDASGNLLTGKATDTEKASAVSFTTSGGSEDMVKTIKGFVDEYNAVMKQVYEAFSTQPAEKSSSTHAKYEPLTDDDKSSMSEKAVENYEAKAKQGILFGDSDLRGLYQKLVNAISPGGSDGAVLREIGIDTTYSGGITQIKLNESKLSAALESDPDKVRNAFTKSKEYGASSNGLMGNLKQTLEQYASTSTASTGILVKKAGSTFSSTSLLSNAVQKQIDSVQTQIQKWQTKMSSKIDYYTRQFTALEKLMNTMNSQSSALSGLMGGY